MHKLSWAKLRRCRYTVLWSPRRDRNGKPWSVEEKAAAVARRDQVGTDPAFAAMPGGQTGIKKPRISRAEHRHQGLFVGTYLSSDLSWGRA